MGHAVPGEWSAQKLLNNSNRQSGVLCSCRRCGISFRVPPSKVKNGRGLYCGRECWIADMPSRRKGMRPPVRYGAQNNKWKGLSAPHPCPVCGTIFTKYNTITCSTECGQTLRSQKISGENNPYRKLHPPQPKTCLLCGIEFTRNLADRSKSCGKHFCSSECYVRGRYMSPRAMWIRRHLVAAGWKVVLEKSWPWLHRPRKIQRMRVDLWLPELRIAIEYDGEHHFRVANGGDAQQLSEIQDRDRVKDRLLKDHGIRLIRLSGWPVDIQMLNYRIWRLSCAANVL